MTIHFNICHTAAYGEEMLLNILTGSGGSRSAVSVGMNTHDGSHWACRLDDIDAKPGERIDFYFSIASAGREHTREWTGITHRLDLSAARAECLRVNSVWHDAPSNARLYTSAYACCIARRAVAPMPRCTYTKTLRLTVRAPQAEPGTRLAITGGGKALGDWDTARALPMTEHNTGEWQIDLNAGCLDSRIEFGFAAIGTHGEATRETAGIRTLDIPCMQTGDMAAYELAEATFDMQPPRLRTAYTSVAQLRSEGSCGVGDLGDLAAYIAATARNAAADIVRLQPVNDTQSTDTAADATPYSITSAYALHPLLCDLRQLPAPADDDARLQAEATRRRLNAEPHTDYMATLAAKTSYLRHAFAQEGDRVMHTADYRRFFADNEPWLVPYAQYSYLREAYAQPDFRLWPSHNEWTEAERGQLQNSRTKAYKKLAFFYYVQYVLHTQLKAAHRLARDGGIVLMGDLTAVLNPNGCDAWKDQARAGTDEWWMRRLAAMECYYDACHVADDVRRRQAVACSTQMWID